MTAPTKVSSDQVLDALAAHPHVTAADLAAVLKIGQSTAAKHLASLETAGTARREVGGRKDGRRVADRWTTTALSGGRHGRRASRTVTGAVAPAGRLARGELGASVRAYLAARPDEDLGPTQIGKALGRSQGAVSNALDRLAASGEATLTQTAPRRYRITKDR